MEYVSPTGRAAITDWRKELSTAARKADLDTFLKMQVTVREWTSPVIKALQGKAWKGLYELRWKSDGVPHRIGGYFADSSTFVMLIGFTHNQKKYDPSATFDTILVRRKQIEKKEASLNEFKILDGSSSKR
jgi:hypothetical protein